VSHWSGGPCGKRGSGSLQHFKGQAGQLSGQEQGCALPHQGRHLIHPEHLHKGREEFGTSHAPDHPRRIHDEGTAQTVSGNVLQETACGLDKGKAETGRIQGAQSPATATTKGVAVPPAPVQGAGDAESRTAGVQGQYPAPAMVHSETLRQPKGRGRFAHTHGTPQENTLAPLQFLCKVDLPFVLHDASLLRKLR